MINLIFSVYVALAIVTLILYLPRLFGLRYGFKKFPHKSVAPKRRIAILVPARGESAIIGDLFDSIERQDYDRDFFETFVIVKESDDPTIELAKKAGASVTVVPEQKCKGDALDGLFKSLSKEKLGSFDAFLIVDADGVFSPNYVSELNVALEYEADIFITRKIAKNFLGNRGVRSLSSNCAALTWPIVDDLGNAYRTKKGIPLNICGQGLMLRREVIEEIGGWPYRTMTEDYELKLDSILRGFKSMYYPHAVLYTEEATSHHENFVRRTRWLTGYKQCNKKYKKSIKNKTKENKGMTGGEKEYFFGMVPYFLFLADTILTAVCGLVLSAYYYFTGSSQWLYALILLTALPIAILYEILLFYSWIALVVARNDFRSITKRERIAVALFNPIYLLEYVCVYFSSLKQFHGHDAPVWHQTERVMKNERKE